jgi:hypothetical protein
MIPMFWKKKYRLKFEMNKTKIMRKKMRMLGIETRTLHTNIIFDHWTVDKFFDILWKLTIYNNKSSTPIVMGIIPMFCKTN